MNDPTHNFSARTYFSTTTERAASYNVHLAYLYWEIDIARHNYPVRTAYLPFVDYTTARLEDIQTLRNVYEC